MGKVGNTAIVLLYQPQHLFDSIYVHLECNDSIYDNARVCTVVLTFWVSFPVTRGKRNIGSNWSSDAAISIEDHLLLEATIILT